MTLLRHDSPTVLTLPQLYPTPPDVTFDGGRLCPVDICHAPLRRDFDGLACTTCPARWDVRGEHGSWSDTDLLALALAAGVVPSTEVTR